MVIQRENKLGKVLVVRVQAWADPRGKKLLDGACYGCLDSLGKCCWSGGVFWCIVSDVDVFLARTAIGTRSKRAEHVRTAYGQ